MGATAHRSCASLHLSKMPVSEGDMTTWTDLLLGSPYGLGSVIVIVTMLAIGGFLAWFLISRSR